jgi:hypothetical protein
MPTHPMPAPGPTSAPPERIPRACLAAWATLLVLYTWAAWRDLPTLMGRILSDDMFYYLGVARHLALEGVAAFDGVSATNGFHPLWMLLLAAFVRLVPDDPILVVHVALATVALCLTVQGLLLERLLALHGHGRLGAWWSIWWLLSPGVVAIMGQGLETALYGTCFLATLRIYLGWRERLSAARALLVGTALGLTALARLDAGLLVLAVGLDAMWLAFRRRAAMVPLALVLPVIALLSPWVIWSVATVGTPLPTSGRALDLWAFDVQAAFLRGRWGDALPGVARNVLEWAAEHLRLLVGLPRIWKPPIPTLAVLLALGLGFAGWVTVRVFADRRYAGFRMLLLVAAAYTGYYLVRWPDSRYILPGVLVEIVVASVVLGDRIEGLVPRWRRRLGRAAAAAAGVGLLALALLLTWQWRNAAFDNPTAPLNATMYAVGVPWIREHTPPEALIGSFNAGILGYLGGRRVVNLDGVINEDAYRALAAHRLSDYIDKTGIGWVIDWTGQLEWFLKHFDDRAVSRLRFEPVAAFEQTWRFGKTRLLVHRVARP